MTRARTPGADPRMREHDQRIRSNVGLRPLFEFQAVPGDARRFKIVGAQTANGSRLLSIPFRSTKGGDDPVPLVLDSLDDEFTLDLDESVLADADGTVGGILDGSVAATTDYWIYAFQTAEGEVKLGIFARPRSTGITMPAGGTGAFGSTAIVTVGTNEGNKYAEGGRVLFRDGTTAGSSWNQATVTSNASANAIVVVLDDDWGLSTNNNTDMTSVTGVECVQLDLPQPRIGGETDSYEEGLPYCYLGSVHTDGSSNIRYWRQAGDWLLTAATYTILDRTSITASETLQVCLGNWVPLGTRVAGLVPYGRVISGTPGRLAVFMGASGVSAAAIFSVMDSAAAFAIWGLRADIPLRTRDGSYEHRYAEAGTLTVQHGALLGCHVEDNW